MRAPGSERRPHNSDAAIFLLVLLLPMPLPLPSAARALSPSSSSPSAPPPRPPSPSPQAYRKTGGHPSSSSTQRLLSPRVVQTQQGSLRGIVLELRGAEKRATAATGRDSHQQQQHGAVPPLDPVEAFWGVAYAAAPVGELRFAPPKPPEKWEGVKLADAFAPVCPQKFPVDFYNRTASLAVMPKGRYLRLRRTLPLLANQSENCLFLNLYVPGGGTSGKKSPTPVIFYIHGESYEWNSGNPYDGSVLASLGQVIVVTVNFRLGALGFMQTGPASTDSTNDPTAVDGNWGLLDVLEALRWIRKNVEAFGGDKDRVAVVGHHTGAALVHLLLVSTAAKGLFQRGVMLSGSAHSLWAVVREPRALRRKVAEKLGCLHPPRPIYSSLHQPTVQPLFPSTPPPAPEGEDVDITPCLRRATTAALLASYPPSLRFLARFGPSLREDDIGPWLEGDGGGRVSPGGVPLPTHSSAPFARTPLLLGVATAEAYSELSAEDVRWGLEEERRDALLRTFVANSFYFHRREILAAVKNEYVDWVGLGSDPRARTARNAQPKFGDGPPTTATTAEKVASAILTPARHHQHPITVRDATVEALGDGHTVAPLVFVTRTHSGDRGAPTYFLHFSHHGRDGVDYAQDRLGSAPEEIVSHLLGYPILGTSPVFSSYSAEPSELPLNYTRQDVAVAAATIKYFSNFAKSGDPNWESQAKREASRSQPWPSGRTEQSGHLPLWLPFDLTSQMHLSMGPKPKMRSHYRSHKMALWLNLVPQLHQSKDEDDTSPHHEFIEKESNYFAGATFNKSIIDPYWRLGAVWSKSVMHTATPPPIECKPISSSENGESISSSSLSNPSLSPQSPIPRNASSPHGEDDDTGQGGAEEDEMEGGGNYLASLSITVTLGVVLLLLNAAVLVAGVLHHYRQKDKARKGKKGCGGEEVHSEQDGDGGRIRFGEFLDSVSDSKSNKDFGEVGTELGLVGLLPRTYPDVMGHDHRTFKYDSSKSVEIGDAVIVKTQPPLDLPSSCDKDAPIGTLYTTDTPTLSRKGQTGEGGTIREAKPFPEPSSSGTNVKRRAQIQEISV